MINCAAGQVSAYRHAHHAWRRECSIRSPPHYRKFVTQLHHRGPDVVEELNLNDRLETAHCQPDSAPHNARFSDGRVKHALRTKITLQTGSELENSAFAFDHLLPQILFAAAIGNVFAKDHDALIALHLVAQRGVDQVGHGLGSRLLAVSRGFGGNRLGVEYGRCGIDIR